MSSVHFRFLNLMFASYAAMLPAVLDAADGVGFDADIRPIFAEHCVACHGGVKQAGNLSFVYRDNVLAGGDSGLPAVVPGDIGGSYLVERVTDSDPDYRMPPAEHGPPLSEGEIEKVKLWIAQGAKWEEPWAFVPPRRVPTPVTQNQGWCLNAIDSFVLAKLESAGLGPSPPAEKTEWLRRVSFDLVGLPPTMEEVDAFLRDRREHAYERVVDRLLASPHFGERWAALWLDLARYADTTGYEKDPHRDIWPYRDWVIRAFNRDMPFDDFTVAQLAGDLLKEPTLDDLLATAFHRNTQTNTEGGTDDEEFRIAAVIDRVNTTWQVWQATTFGCTQCHSHPYEPIRHEDYYRFLAFFNNTRDADIDEEFPTLGVPLSRDDVSRAEQIHLRQAQLRGQLHDWVLPIANEPDQWRNLRIDRAESTGETVLRIEPASEPTSATEVKVDGAATIGSKFTIESPLPDGIEQVTALRIDALLRDAASARKIPEVGFILSRIRVFILPPHEGKPHELEFVGAFSDEPQPLLNPADSLNDNDFGWGSYSRLWYPQFAVFLLKEPVVVSPGSRIRIQLEQKSGTSGDVALVLNRSTCAVSANEEWVRLQNLSEFASARQQLEDLDKQAEGIAHTSIPVFDELAAERSRSTFVFERGLWLDKGVEVQPGVPAVLPALSHGGSPNRLDMSRWLVSDENPLTARVIVNRVWAELFGIGIVETVDNFGVSGTPPSHPELLDFLAVSFRDDLGWSVKNLLREIVLSATYRQSARQDAEAMKIDPQNRLLWRGPRGRLTAEMIRDQALVVSGKFSPKMFGAPVMPPQPEGIWRSVYNNAKWINATGEDRYRRAIYTYWKRTSGYPSLMTFDMPSREVCTGRRITTNTPLQALVTLNDEAYLELAEGLAQRMAAEGGATVQEKLSWAYQLASGKTPAPATLAELVGLYEKTAARYRKSNAEARPDQSSTEQAALMVVASTLLNLDEFLTK